MLRPPLTPDSPGRAAGPASAQVGYRSSIFPHLSLVSEARLDDRAGLASALGLRLRGLTDGELILAAYGKWGADCPRHLLGDYAFVIRDEAAGALFGARDHIGARPFFYSFEGGRFRFAGDIPTLLDEGVSDALDEDLAAYALSVMAPLPQDRTLLKAVRRLPPGHGLTVKDGGLRVWRYWSPEDSPPVRLKDDAAYRDAFLALHRQAVEDRLPDGDVGLGVHVSGGLDCSGIAAVANTLRRARGEAAPVGFCWQVLPDGAAPRDGEQAWIDAVRRHLDIDLHAPQPTGADLLDLLRRDGSRHPDAGNLFHEGAVQRQAQALGVRVILSGWGGDEAVSFNGRGLYPQLLREGRIGALADLARAFGQGAPRFILGRSVLPMLKAVLPRGNGRRPDSLIDPGFLRRSSPPRPPRYRNTAVRDCQMDLYHDGHITERLEDWAIHGRRHGVEYRYPLLDRRVMEFAYGLPVDQFRRGRWNRWLMRNAMATLLPAEVAWNPSKDEPVRIERLTPTLTAAFAAIGRELDQREAPPSRAVYLDMPRLRRALDTYGENRPTSPRPWPIRTALQLLDLE